MAILPTTYVRFADGVETIQPDEERLTDETVASMARTNRMMFEKHRHAIRDAHAKSHGVLKAELHVYENLPPHLAQGVFQPGTTYPVIVRLSSAPGAISSDKMTSFRGMALKIIGVEGPKILPNQADEITQDFLLVTDPVIPTGDIKSYHDRQLQLEQFARTPEGVQQAVATVAKGANAALHAVGIDVQLNPLGPGHAHHHLLGETYHSMGAFRYGDYVAKLSVAPLSENVRAFVEQTVDIKEDGQWRDIVEEFFRTQGAEYELRAQLCTDLNAMPVEDASVEWPAEQSPYQPVGKLVIMAQESFSPARRVYADDVLSFNPFHAIAEHQPLGSINRARRKAYDTSSQYRHQMNAQPRQEPRDISELPE